MKLLIRWSTLLSLAGSSLFFTFTSGNTLVLALTEQQIKEKLDPVPVFLITNNKRVPLTRTVPKNSQNRQNGQKKNASVTDVFMSGQEAQAFLNKLRNTRGKDPKMAKILKDLQITAVPLGTIYQRLRKTANQQNPIFAFKADKQNLEGAMLLLRQSGKEVKQFPSIPVFIVRSPEKGYISVKKKNDNKEIIPLFFSKKDAQGLLQRVKTQVSNTDIQVVDINNVVKTLREKDDVWLSQVSLIPSSESISYVKTTNLLQRDGLNLAIENIIEGSMLNFQSGSF